VLVRGVLHVLGAADRARVAANLGALTGPGGIVLLAETNYPGSLLGYLESLGAGPRGLPHPLARAIATGIPRPSRFGRAELAAAFPPDRWEVVLLDGTARITTVPLPGAAAPGSVPGFLALLRRR
jgi:hypothetical protein